MAPTNLEWYTVYIATMEHIKALSEGWKAVYSTYVAWELGNEQLFAESLEQLCFITSVNDAGHLCTGSGTDAVDLTKVDHLGPPDLIGKHHTRNPAPPLSKLPLPPDP